MVLTIPLSSELRVHHTSRKHTLTERKGSLDPSKCPDFQRSLIWDAGSSSSRECVQLSQPGIQELESPAMSFLPGASGRPGARGSPGECAHRPGDGPRGPAHWPGSGRCRAQSSPHLVCMSRGAASL